MSREIKFRYWSDLDNQWFYKSIQQVQSEHWDTPIDVEWQQFTGLKDRNGREIYEGDIVRGNYPLHSGKTKEVEGEVAFDLEQFIGYRVGNTRMSALDSRLAVIGNIYENPELLEPKEKADG